MPDVNRLRKINEEIQRVLSEIIPRLKDPRVRGVVSVTRVDTVRDLSQARVYVSVLDGDVRAVVGGLKSAAAHIRHELASTLSLRRTPELLFVPDDSIQRGAQIGETLSKLFPKEDTAHDRP